MRTPGVPTDRRTRDEVFVSPLPIAASRHVVAAPVPAHVHDFVELALVTDGQVGHTTTAGVDELTSGDLVVVRPGAWHAYAPLAGGVEVINIYLGAELLTGQLSWVLDHPPLARLLLLGGRLSSPVAVRPRERLVGWLDQLAAELHDSDPVTKVGLIGCVLVELARAEGRSGHQVPTIGAAVRTSLQLLTGDLARGWTITDLGNAVGLSPSALYRRFRAELGAGPVEWLTRSRAEAAASLLVQTTLPVAAVGRRVGWADPSYASRRFAQVYGVSPSAYRAQHSGRAPATTAV